MRLDLEPLAATDVTDDCLRRRCLSALAEADVDAKLAATHAAINATALDARALFGDDYDRIRERRQQFENFKKNTKCLTKN